jgi:hypothetical protein
MLQKTSLFCNTKSTVGTAGPTLVKLKAFNLKHSLKGFTAFALGTFSSSFANASTKAL